MRKNKFSASFLKIYNFFLESYNAGLITFSGTDDLVVVHNSDAPNAKFCFKEFENGVYTTTTEIVGVKYKSILPIETSEPEELYAVIKGKKSWGLWIKEWAGGIGEWCFTTEEIVGTFTAKGIEIPESLMNDFTNVINKEKAKRYK
tara:strand:+ start:824 stop:1261 length:438 start_codon:yes stop_codon:yes gene_type:complete